ncbi:hypothetical protein [Streptomyces sp. NPDC056948]|uniref:hypothetical protein n=1 Tax=Streptomyces sp. NPDC056948 TaxID=3345975 RepID=UPI00363F5F50
MGTWPTRRPASRITSCSPDSRGTFADDRDQQAVNVFRLYSYKGGHYSHRLLLLGREVHHALNVLADRSPTPSPTCGDILRRAAEAGLPQ